MHLTHKQWNQIQAHIITNLKPNLLNSLLRSLTLSNTPHNALFLYNHMVHRPTSHDHFTYTYALQSSSLLHSFHKSHEIHARIIKSGHLSDIFIQNSLLHMFITSNDISSARLIFHSIDNPDVVSWTTLISGLVKSGLDTEALRVFKQMDAKPTSVTIVAISSACSNLRVVTLGKAIHCYYLRNMNAENGIFVYNTLLNMYAVCGCIGSAQNLFEKMGKRDVVTWTTMLGGYAHQGYYQKAFSIFQDMLEIRDIQPNETTFVNVLYACAAIGELTLGKKVHSYMNGRSNIVVDGHVGNALVNMYVKCGEMGIALDVFNSLERKDVISWSSVLGGFAMNGYGKQALEVFSLMICNGIDPDAVTFICLISACSHAGLVDKGIVFFESMQSVYGITPQLEHYACMVDMFGRAGQLVEAETFVRNMPVEPDGPLWGALLNACKLHGSLEMLERLKLNMLGLSGVSGGTYALVSNMYSNLNRWDEADKVRDVMRSRGVRKIPGCSQVTAL